MSNNYVDFGYWEYGYCEGDIEQWSIYKKMAEWNWTGMMKTNLLNPTK
jgi:hypothetical protein